MNFTGPSTTEEKRVPGETHWNADEKPLRPSMYLQWSLTVPADKEETFHYYKRMKGRLETRDEKLVTRTFI